MTTEQNAPKIKIDTDIAYVRRGWPETRYVAAVNDVWLARKDGGLRKFKTPQAARAAALEVATKAAQ